MLKLIDTIPFCADAWPGEWMWTETAERSLDVVQFALRFSSREISFPLRLHISADNRYKLYIDGKFEGLGPQRGDISKWYFDTYEFSSLGDEKEHVISAIVFCDRFSAPSAQISLRPAFLAVAEGDNAALFNAAQIWQCRSLPNYKSLPVPEEAIHAGGGFDMSGMRIDDLAPSAAMISNEFGPAVPILLGRPKDYRSKFVNYCDWRLTPRTLPAMNAELHPLGQCRRIKNGAVHHNTMDLPLIIKPHSTCKFLIDNGVVTKGYPIINISGGAGAEIHVTYQEGLQSNGQDITTKGHRDDIAGCDAVGVRDIFRSDGRENINCEPLWYRCWRYISFEIITGNEPLHINSMMYRSTGYPFEFKADIKADAWMERLVNPGLQTLRMCAEDTYMDCPYYEQLQYISDTRIQALLSYILAGDDRLARQAIDAFDRSRLPDGMLQARYPSRWMQIIPTFALYYISILYDFVMWRGDIDFIKKYLCGVKLILQAFEEYQRSDGLLTKLPGWCFIDWSSHSQWHHGVSPDAPDETSYLVNFQYLYALKHAEQLFYHCDDIGYAEKINIQAGALRKRLQKLAFDDSKQLFIDDCSAQHLSQHTNILAILTDCCDGLVDSSCLLEQIIQDEELAQVSCYYSFYMFEAMYHASRADMIWPELSRWHEMLDCGLTTFPENYGKTRSDCHGWSAHPLYHYFASILGIRPTAPGCSQMSINPVQKSKVSRTFPLNLSGEFMTPYGKMKVLLKSTDTDWEIYSERGSDNLKDV